MNQESKTSKVNYMRIADLTVYALYHPNHSSIHSRFGNQQRGVPKSTAAGGTGIPAVIPNLCCVRLFFRPLNLVIVFALQGSIVVQNSELFRFQMDRWDDPRDPLPILVCGTSTSILAVGEGTHQTAASGERLESLRLLSQLPFPLDTFGR